jgi:polysaccharide pyruvyl transferase WcaK-like protein
MNRVKKNKIFVVNQCASNKGDRAVLQFLIRELARNGVSDITVATTNPSLWRGVELAKGARVRFIFGGTRISPRMGDNVLGKAERKLRRYLFRKTVSGVAPNLTGKSRQLDTHHFFLNGQFLEELSACDAVMSTGGHHLSTLHSNGRISPNTFDMLLCTTADKPLILWAQSIGPFHYVDPRDIEIVRTILTKARTVVLREPNSRKVLLELGVADTNVIESYDSVFGLNDVIADYVPPSKRENAAGISIYSGKRLSPQDYDKYVGSLAALVDHFSRSGLKVWFFPMELKGSISDDRHVIADIVHRSRISGDQYIIEPDMDTLSHMQHVARCKIFVGHKTHSVIFSLTTGTPILAIAYHPKTVGFMKQYDLSEFCVDDTRLTEQVLLSKADALFCTLDDVGRQEFGTSRRIGAAVRTHFSQVLEHCSEAVAQVF